MNSNGSRISCKSFCGSAKQKKKGEKLIWIHNRPLAFTRIPINFLENQFATSGKSFKFSFSTREFSFVESRSIFFYSTGVSFVALFAPQFTALHVNKLSLLQTYFRRRKSHEKPQFRHKFEFCFTWFIAMFMELFLIENYDDVVVVLWALGHFH